MKRSSDYAVQEWANDAQRQAVERLARQIVRLDLADIATFLIESLRPLNFVGSQLLRFFSPFVHAFGRFPDYEALATLLEDRRSVDWILQAIEQEQKVRAQEGVG